MLDRNNFIPVYYDCKKRIYTTKRHWYDRYKCDTVVFLERKTGRVAFLDENHNELKFYQSEGKYCILEDGKIISER